jgi:uncharacterized delta-60 repeat protein
MNASNNNPDRRQCAFEPLESRQMFAAGMLDSTFSFDGRATAAFPGGIATAADTVVQANGKTIVVGQVEFTATNGSKVRRFAVARFNFDGTLDRTFGPSKNGTVHFDMGNKHNAGATAVALQTDGSIVVVGSAEIARTLAFDTREFAVARLLSTGELDTGFSGDGKQLIRIKHDSFANDVAIQQDGKIVVVGGDFNGGGILTINDSDFAICRLNRDGSLDKSFAGGGKRIIGLGENESARAVAIDTNGLPNTNPNFGKIILAGNLNKFPSRQDYAIVRLNPNGTNDNRFDGNGQLAGNFPGHAQAFVSGVMIQPITGRLIVVGHATGGNTPFALRSHRGDGSIDTTFGPSGDGAAFIDFGGNDRATDIMFNLDRKLVVAGVSNGRFALAGLTEQGRTDRSFGFEGKVVTDFGPAGTASAVRMTRGPGNRITVVGGKTFKTARYLDSAANIMKLSDGILNTAEGSPDKASFVVSRSEILPISQRVFFKVAGTATAPGILNRGDYTLTGMSQAAQTNTRTGAIVAQPIGGGAFFVDIPAGQKLTLVTVAAGDDSLIEGTETAVFTIAPSAAYSLGETTSFSVTIADNDGPTSPPGPVTVAPPLGKLHRFSTSLIRGLV